jgi:hypothetical protein
MKRQFYIGIAASILCLSQLSNIDTAQAQLNCQNVANGCLKINTQALQMIVNVSEIESQNTVQKVGEGSLPNLQPLTGSSFAPPNTEIIRTTDHLWQLEVEEGSENNFTADYVCSNFTHPAQNSPSIETVSIQSTGITPVGPSSSNPGKVVIQGAAKFTFDLSNTKASGNYSCDLQINVIENNPT